MKLYPIVRGNLFVTSINEGNLEHCKFFLNPKYDIPWRMAIYWIISVVHVVISMDNGHATGYHTWWNQHLSFLQCTSFGIMLRMVKFRDIINSLKKKPFPELYALLWETLVNRSKRNQVQIVHHACACVINTELMFRTKFYMELNVIFIWLQC